MASPTPLFPQAEQPDEPLESPEILVINALIKSGRFDPHAYGIDVDMLAGYQQAWSFCQDYQDQTGKPPSVELFSRSFPTVEILGGEIDPGWAADRLKSAHYEREVRRKLGEASRAMRAGNLDEVREAIRDLALPSPMNKPKGMNINDTETVSQAGVKVGFNTPFPSMNAATNGIGRGEVWLLGARLGQGKSQLLPGYAFAAAKQGAKVAIASCEMPMRQYAKRVHPWWAGGDVDLLRALRHPDEDTRQAALASLPPLVGSLDVFDPSVMRMNLRSIENLCSEYDYVAIDHVGLLQDNTGRRAIDDWRVAATISNSLKEYALRFNIAMMNAVQINREGETASSAPPKVSQISQTDSLGQDADGIVLLRRIGERSMLHSVAKNREGHNARFYTKFEPAIGDYSEISAEEARSRALIDNDQLAGQG